MRILLVEDEPALLLTLGEALCDAGHEVERCATGSSAVDRMRHAVFDLLVTDIRLPGVDGCTLAEAALQSTPPMPVILMTAYGGIDQAVSMMKRGATDYLTKPVDELALVATVGRLAAGRASHPSAGEPVAESQAMRATLRLARQVAPSGTSVLLTGETGVGKEVLARFIHAMSPRAAGPFVGANCASIPRDLVEAELFGHTRAAYTGAREARQGWIRTADGGTLLLDELGELGAGAQASLLRVIEERQVLPVGADRPIPVHVRILGATNRDLDTEQVRGNFRSDLYYRLCGFEIHIPPLRERVEDIPPLAHRFLAGLAPEAAPSGFAPDTMEILAAYSWPGNVRELRNAVEHAAILAGTASIRPSHLPNRIRTRVPDNEPFALRHAVERVEEAHIRRALALSGGGRQRAADMLAISRKHLWELMKRYQIKAPGDGDPQP